MISLTGTGELRLREDVRFDFEGGGSTSTTGDFRFRFRHGRTFSVSAKRIKFSHLPSTEDIIAPCVQCSLTSCNCLFRCRDSEIQRPYVSARNGLDLTHGERNTRAIGSPGGFAEITIDGSLV